MRNTPLSTNSALAYAQRADPQFFSHNARMRNLTHLQRLEAESIDILREAVAESERPVVERDGMLIMVDDARFSLRKGESSQQRHVRFRTLGCYPLSGAIESRADTLPAIIREMLLATTTERQGRLIDHDAGASMEKKKVEGYF